MTPRFRIALLATTLLLAAAAAGISTWLMWLPCQGTMFNGLLGLREASGFSDACLARMDGNGALPLAIGVVEFRALSAILLALGWWTYASALRISQVHGASRASRVSQILILLPILPIVWFAVETLLATDGGTIWEATSAAATISLTSALAGIIILLHPAENRTRYVGLIGLCGVASYGAVHAAGDYMLMIGVHTANWDVPPGTGYVTALVMAVCGVVVAVWGWRSTRAQEETPHSAPSDSLRATSLVTSI